LTHHPRGCRFVANPAARAGLLLRAYKRQRIALVLNGLALIARKTAAYRSKNSESVSSGGLR
jgi:hypothetical protein